MSSLNLFAGQGNLVADAEVVGKESNVARFTLAINNGFGDRRTTTFMPCVAFGKQVEVIGKYFKKGKQVIVRGAIIQNNWKDSESGEPRSRLELRLDGFNGFNFVGDGSGKGGEEAAGSEVEASAPKAAAVAAPVPAPVTKDEPLF
jgi:single-strand DNA-binding protein